MTLWTVFRPLVLASALQAAAPPTQRPAFDRTTWLSDYARLKQALAQDYANLDWQVARRGMNLASADRTVTGWLDDAKDDTAATLAIVRLVDAFHDPHLALAPGPAPDGATLVPRASDIAGPAVLPSACAAEHYTEARPATRLPYAAAPGWHEISAAPFQAGLIGSTGIIRIPEFSETRYLEACQAVARPGLAGRDLQRATRAELNRRLVALVATLRQRRMTRLVIDLSRNGGGSEWSSIAATLFAPGPLTRTAPRRVGPACDRAAMWTGAEPPCPIYRAATETETAEPIGPPAWRGPLAILADHRTASAAEEFITWLRDNHKAVTAGERTAGAGCGYIDGGSSFQFRAVPMHLMIPNCSRFTRNGTNEIEGQAPDLAVDWATLDPAAVPATLDALFRLSPR